MPWDSYHLRGRKRLMGYFLELTLTSVEDVVKRKVFVLTRLLKEIGKMP